VAEFHWPVRIYYEDTDTGGVVYYANYLKYMERARTEWLRSYGLEQDALRTEQNVIFAVRSVHVDYLKPARFNQLLSVSAEIIETGKASMTFRQEVVLNNNSENVDGDVLCRGQVRIACLDADSMRPCPIPESVRKEILSDG
jgi:acyl-CoA thioester hydrolase